MMQEQGELTYCRKTDRWMFTGTLSSYSLHCGEAFRLWLDGKWISCRIELGSDWYVIFRNATFNLKPGQVYRASV